LPLREAENLSFPGGNPAFAVFRALPSMISSTKRVAVTAGILLGMLLGALEATVVSTAMPTVVASLGGLEIYSWVFSAYLLTSTVTVPLWGKLSDLYGRRRFYVLCVGFFFAGSILCGVAQSMAQLVAFRAVQGMGAGGLFSLGMTIIAELYTPVERARIQGYFSSVWGVASIAGPFIGGFLTDQLNWRWVFYINVPFAFAAALVIWTQLDESGAHRRERRLDLAGVGLFSLSMTLLMVLLIRSETSFEFRSPVFAALLGGAVAAFALFVRAERRSAEPLLPVELFRNRTFTGATLNAFVCGIVMFGILSFIPLFVQGVQGTGATEAGSVLTPLLLGWVVTSTVGGRLLMRYSFRQVMFVGMALMLAGYLLLDGMTAETSRLIVLRNVLFLGSGMGLAMIASMIAVQHSVERAQLGIATSTSQFFRSIGSAIGVAVLGTVLTQRLNQEMASASQVTSGLGSLIENPNVFLQPAVRESLPPQVVLAFQGMLASSLHTVFLVGTVICFAGLLCVWLVPPARLVTPTETAPSQEML
jgi:EmrB/QacA subfamily drug resistance transporter